MKRSLAAAAVLALILSACAKKDEAVPAANAAAPVPAAAPLAVQPAPAEAVPPQPAPAGAPDKK